VAKAAQNVQTPTGGGYADGDIPRPPKRLNLTLEHRVEAQIICARRQGRRIRRQGDRGNRLSIRLVTNQQFRGDVLSVRRAAAVPKEKQFSSRRRRSSMIAKVAPKSLRMVRAVASTTLMFWSNSRSNISSIRVSSGAGRLSVSNMVLS
jgi:hypothetical protein